MGNIKNCKHHKILKTSKIFLQQCEITQQHLTYTLSTWDIHTATFLDKDKSNYKIDNHNDLFKVLKDWETP